MTRGNKRLIVAITGASGAVYGVNAVKALAGAGLKVELVISSAGKKVMFQETGLKPGDLLDQSITLYSDQDIAAPIASGSFPVDAMAIIPCSMASLAAIASGKADTLIFRAADVTLKEGRPLLLAPRESPMNRIHLQNMLFAHDAGAIIMPAAPPFYGAPKSMEELVNHMTGRILDRLGIDNSLAPRWTGEE